MRWDAGRARPRRRSRAPAADMQPTVRARCSNATDGAEEPHAPEPSAHKKGVRPIPCVKRRPMHECNRWRRTRCTTATDSARTTKAQKTSLHGTAGVMPGRPRKRRGTRSTNATDGAYPLQGSATDGATTPRETEPRALKARPPPQVKEKSTRCKHATEGAHPMQIIATDGPGH